MATDLNSSSTIVDMIIDIMKTLYIAFVVLLLHSALVRPVPIHSVQRRRVKPKTTKPLTLEELARQCTHHGWTNCANRAAEMKDMNSDLNKDFEICLNETKQEQGTLSLDLTSKAPIQSNRTVEPTVKCPVKSKEKRVARTQYCNYIKEIYLIAMLVMGRLENRVHCVIGKQDDGELTPQEILEGLKYWHSEFIKRRRSCCSPLELETVITIQTHLFQRDCGRLPSLSYERRWSEDLSRMAELIKAEDVLSNLGRRRMCLRGCVGTQEVACVGSVFI